MAMAIKLPSAECNDAARRIVRGDTDGHSVSRHDPNAEAAHAAAELSDHFVSRVRLYSVESAAVYRRDRSLNVD